MKFYWYDFVGYLLAFELTFINSTNILTAFLQPEYVFELETDFDFGSNLKRVLEEESKRIQALEEEFFGLSSPLTPLTISTPSHCGSPDGPDFVDVMSGLTLKRQATGSPHASLPSSDKPPTMDGSKKQRRRENRRHKRKKEATANPEFPPVTGNGKKKRRRVNRRGRREREMTDPVSNPEQGGYGHTMYVKPSVPLKIETDFKEARVASTGYIGLDDKIRSSTDMPLEGLLDGTYARRRFRLQKWDGKYVLVFVQNVL